MPGRNQRALHQSMRVYTTDKQEVGHVANGRNDLIMRTSREVLFNCFMIGATAFMIPSLNRTNR